MTVPTRARVESSNGRRERGRGFFGEAEWLPRDRLEAIQLHKLQALVARAGRTNEYYGRIFEAAGVTPEGIRSLADYSDRVPLTRKSDLLTDQEIGQPWGTRLGVPPSAVRQITITGGTSGRGQEVHGSTSYEVETTAAAHAWGCYLAGVRPGDLVLNTLPVGLSAGGQWVYRSLLLQGAVPLQVGMYDSETKLRDLVRFGARVIVANPAYLMSLEGSARRLGIDLAAGPVEIVLTAGEPFSAAWVERTQQVWGARVFSWYGATQRVIAANCEVGAAAGGKLGMLHAPAQLIYLEVVDPETGAQVTDSEEGEIVFTFLESIASPVLRFASGDRGVFRRGASCACGRSYDGIEGGRIYRYDDMLKIRGVNVWPSSVDDIVFAHREVNEYRGRVFTDPSGREEVVVTLDLDADSPHDRGRQIVERIADEIRRRIGLRFVVQVSPEAFPRFAHDQHKPRRWSDERVGRQ